VGDYAGVFVIGAVAVAALIIVGIGASSKCAACGKWFALQEQGRTLTGTRATTRTESREIRNQEGEVVGTTDVDVPAVEREFRVSYRCKNCGHTQAKTKTTQSAT
jgi:DNA-directed RNA polymerase subunit RPC12/RpoP